MRYQRLLALGSGGMANVHLSLALGQSGFKRLVVVKSVREELLGDPNMRQMFLAEARLSARLNHPNVVQVSEVVETGDGVMLVMEYLDGLAFSAACRAAGASLTRTMRLRVLCDVLAGLAYAHDLVDYHGQPLGIVHRDVSAQNVLLTFDGRVKLLDFGIAKVTSAPDKTRTGVIKGRVAYMPIEQVTGKQVDRRTDVYAVGCLMWEAVAGSRLWGTLTEPQIIRNVLQGSMPALSSRVPVDSELERIVTKATASRPDDRHATAEELRIELERYLSHLPPVSAREIGELLSSVCGDARSERKRELAEAIAHAERELTTQGFDVDGSSSQRLRAVDPTQASGISQVPYRTQRSMSPTPGPFLSSAPPTSGPTDDRKSASFSGTLRPRRRGGWLALGLAAALAAAAWVPSFLAQRTLPAAAAALPAAASLSQAAATPGGPAEPTDAARAAETNSAAPTPSSSSSAKARHARPHLPTVSVKPTTATASPTAGTRAGCNPPYYFSAGIKTYKPECI
jgi:eukaryotic-like serine/threonine-protein kinase